MVVEVGFLVGVLLSLALRGLLEFCKDIYHIARGTAGKREAALREEIEVELLDQLYPRIRERVVEQYREEITPALEARIGKERAALIHEGEAKGLVRLAAAFEQARRTGEPVTIEIAGESFCVAVPPPGTTPTQALPN